MSDSSWGRERDLRATPSPAFGGGDQAGGGADDAGGDTSDPAGRVDELFTRAVERQVAEQRTLNRLLEDVEQQMSQVRHRVDELQQQLTREVGPTLDRLGALDAGLRSLRESVSAQSVALRTEVQETLEQLRAEVRERGERSDQHLTELRDADGRSGEELTGLVERIATSLSELDARQASLREDVTGLRTEVERSVSAHLERGLDGLPAQFETGVAALREDVQQDLGALRTRLDQLSMQLDRPVESLGAGLRALRTDVLEELERTRAALDARGRLLDESTESVGDDVTRVLAQVRGELDDRAAALSERVAQLEGAIVGRVEAALAGQRADRGTQAADLGERLEQLEQRLGAQQSQMRELLERELEERLAAQQSQMRDLFETQRSVLEGVVASLAGAQDARAGATDELRSWLQERLDQVAADLAARSDAAANEHAEALAAATEQFRATAATVTTELSELESVSTQLTQMRARLDGGLVAIAHQADRLVADRDEASAGLDQVLRERLASSASEQRELLQRLQQRMDGLDASLAERLDGGLGRQQAVLESSIADLTGSDRASTEELAGRLDRLGERLAAQSAEIVASLDPLRERLDGLSEDVVASFDPLQERLVAAQHAVLEDVAAAQAEAEARLGRAGEVLERSAAEVERRAGALDEQLAEVLDGVSQDLRSEADAANVELRSAAGRLDATFQQLRHLESSLVAYLEARDRRLEHDRAQLLREVLDQLTAGLSKRERRRYARNLEEAVGSLPEPPPAAGGSPATPGPKTAARSPRPALADLLGEDFDSPDLAPETDTVPGGRPGIDEDLDDDGETDEVVEQAAAPDRPEAADGHECPECGFVAKSAGGLASHRRTHA